MRTDSRRAPKAKSPVTRARRPSRSQTSRGPRRKWRSRPVVAGGAVATAASVTSGDQLVAHAADGEDVARQGGGGLHLGPQAADVDVDQPPVAEVVVAPDPVEQLLAGQHLVRVGGELAQEAELGAG